MEAEGFIVDLWKNMEIVDRIVGEVMLFGPVREIFYLPILFR